MMIPRPTIDKIIDAVHQLDPDGKLVLTCPLCRDAMIELSLNVQRSAAELEGAIRTHMTARHAEVQMPVPIEWQRAA